MTISLTSSRASQVVDVATAWSTNFNKPFTTTWTEQDFLSIYSNDIPWYDHAFHIQRVGHDAVLGLRNGFLHCNQPFRSRVKAIWPTPSGAVIEVLWIGSCTNDIVRPNGEVVVRASGQHFKSHVCMILQISEYGKIERIDEYYNRAWDQGVREEDYSILQGVSHKAP